MHAAVMTTRLVPAAAAEVHAQWCMPPAKRKCTAITRSSAEWGSFHSRRQVQSLIASAAQAEFPGEAAVAATPDAAHAEEDPHEGYQLFKLVGTRYCEHACTCISHVPRKSTWKLPSHPLLLCRAGGL